MKKGGLGKGLKALIIENATDMTNQVVDLDIIDIEPNKNQPRKNFDSDKLNDLAQSISQIGIIQPIIVKPKGNSLYEIIAGERRWRASRIAGLKTIPAIIKNYENKDAMEAALIENLQREDLNAVEIAEAYSSLMNNFELTQEEISKRVGKSRSAVANSLRILNLPKEIKNMVAEGALTEGHARTFLAIESVDKMLEVAKNVVNLSLNVRQTENMVKTIVNQKEVAPTKRIDQSLLQYHKISSALSKRLGTKVHISNGKRKGKIEIEYYGQDDLERIIDLFK